MGEAGVAGTVDPVVICVQFGSAAPTTCERDVTWHCVQDTLQMRVAVHPLQCILGGAALKLESCDVNSQFHITLEDKKQQMIKVKYK